MSLISSHKRCKWSIGATLHMYSASRCVWLDVLSSSSGLLTVREVNMCVWSSSLAKHSGILSYVSRGRGTALSISLNDLKKKPFVGRRQSQLEDSVAISNVDWSSSYISWTTFTLSRVEKRILLIFSLRLFTIQVCSFLCYVSFVFVIHSR